MELLYHPGSSENPYEGAHHPCGPMDVEAHVGVGSDHRLRENAPQVGRSRLRAVD
jgi:hypothetical protein